MVPTLVLGLISGLTSVAYGQQARPDIGNILRENPIPVAPALPEAPLPEIGGKPAEPQLKSLPGGSASVLVKRFDIIGNKQFSSEDLRRLVAEGEGKSLTLSQLEELASKITLYYRQRGFFVSRAYIPAQELTDGVVKVRVIEGNYGRFTLNNKSLVKDQKVQAILDAVKDQDIVSTNTLERAMLIINDTPGAQITQADVVPGTQVGTSDFLVGTKATQEFGGYVIGDNYGSRYTGLNRLSVGADWNSPTGAGDRLSFAGLTSNDANLLNGRLAYSYLLNPNGLRGELAVGRTTYRLTDVYAPLDAVGVANSVEANLSYPLRRTRALTVELNAGLAHRSLEDQVRSTNTKTPKKINSAVFGVSGNAQDMLFGLAGLTQGSLSATWGRLSFGDDQARTNDFAGANTQGDYGKVNYAFSRLSKFNEKLSVSASFRGQRTLFSKNLDGSERMSIGGANGVKAYPNGELSGENAWLFNTEALYAMPSWNGASISLAAFYDAGRASMQNPVGNVKPRTLSDAGVGVYADYRQFFMKFQVARRLNEELPRSEPVHSPKYLLQAGTRF